MARTRAIIFDLDGVLTDTAEFHYQAWKRLADERGLPFDRHHNQALRGVSREESLRRLLGPLKVSPAKFAAMLHRKNDYYLAMIATLTPADLAPGAADLLRDLNRANWKLAIASASRNAQQVVDRLAIRRHFAAIIDGAAVTRSKPAPDLFLEAARRLDAHPQTAIVIEDAPSGIEAARAAQMRAIAVGPDAAESPADLHITSIAELNVELAESLAADPAYGAAPTVSSNCFGPF